MRENEVFSNLVLPLRAVSGDNSPQKYSARLNLWTLLAMIGSWILIQGSANSATQADESSGIASVQASLSAPSVQVAEPVWLKIVVTASSGAKVSFPVKSSQLGEFEVVNDEDVFDIPSAVSPEQRIWTRTLQLESLVTGHLVVPAIEISVTADGTSETLRTQTLPIEVVSVLDEAEDPTQFRDILSVVDVPSAPIANWAGLWWTLAGVVALSLIAVVAVWIVRRKKWITPESWATRQIEQLSRSSELQAGDSQHVLQSMARILRSYVELKFQIAATVKSSAEFMQLAEQQLGQATASEYGKLLVLADEAKFAGRHVDQAELAQVVDRAKDLIQLSDTVRTSVANSAREMAEVA